jgi:hypothetical protein
MPCVKVDQGLQGANPFTRSIAQRPVAPPVGYGVRTLVLHLHMQRPCSLAGLADAEGRVGAQRKAAHSVEAVAAGQHPTFATCRGQTQPQPDTSRVGEVAPDLTGNDLAGGFVGGSVDPLIVGTSFLLAATNSSYGPLKSLFWPADQSEARRKAPANF